MVLGSIARSRAIATLRRVMLLVPFVLSVGLVPGAVRAADPRNMDGLAAPAAGPIGGAAGPVAAIPPRSGAPIEPPRVVFHGPRTSRVVALTFDDGYAPANVRLIFTELVQAGVAATFFVNGAYLHQDPRLWRAIAAAGYPIGNHTVLHEDVRGRPPAQVVADLVRNARLVQQVTGRPMIPVFRPPYGYHDAASDADAVAAGFPSIVLWDVTGADTDRRASDATVLANASAGRPGSIVLLHAGPSVTPRILPALIARYRARGFSFVTVPELLGIADTALRLPPGGGWSLPDPGGATAPTPPAVPPAGDDRGGLPSPVGGAPAPSTGPAAMPPTDGTTVGPGAPGTAVGAPAGRDAAPPPGVAGGSSGIAAMSPLARDSAWARGPSRDGLVAGVTVALLALLLLLGAIVGRRARHDA